MNRWSAAVLALLLTLGEFVAALVGAVVFIALITGVTWIWGWAQDNYGPLFASLGDLIVFGVGAFGILVFGLIFIGGFLKNFRKLRGRGEEEE